MLTDPIKTDLYRFLDGRTPHDEFERWVYATPALEAAFDRDSYIDLLATDFSHPRSREQITDLITPLIDHGDYATWQIRNALAVILRRDEAELPNALDRIYYWYCKGYRFLESLALGFSLDVRVPASVYTAAEWTDEWDDLPLDAQAAILASFYPEIAGKAARIMRWLDEGKIVITGGQLKYDCLLEYLDHRSREEAI